MKFVKGFVVGSIVSASIAMMCTESMNMGKNSMIKKGRQFVKKMGIM